MIPSSNLTRRNFVKASLAAAAGASFRPLSAIEVDEPAPKPKEKEKLIARADSVIFIWLPGGVAQTDTWDPKKFTPFQAGMKGSELLGTCESIRTTADAVMIGAGLDNVASVMKHGTILRSLTNETKFGAIHLKAQYYMMTGYLFPAGVKVPSIGAAIGRTLGRKDPHVPAYIYIGRDIDTSDEERLFISEYIGPGFYGSKAPSPGPES